MKASSVRCNVTLVFAGASIATAYEATNMQRQLGVQNAVRATRLCIELTHVFIGRFFPLETLR